MLLVYMDKVKIVCRALIVDDQGQILVVKKTGSDFWSLPGGKVDPEDVSVQVGLVRELQEELGVEAEIKDIRFVQELQKDDTRYVELIWQATLTNGSVPTQEDIAGISDHELIDIQWIKKENLGNIDVKPAFLKELV